MAETKKPKTDDIIKPAQGYLCCDTCGSVVAYRGFSVPTLKDPWPMHRCGFQVRPFDKFSLTDPSREPLS